MNKLCVDVHGVCVCVCVRMCVCVCVCKCVCVCAYMYLKNDTCKTQRVNVHAVTIMLRSSLSKRVWQRWSFKRKTIIGMMVSFQLIALFSICSPCRSVAASPTCGKSGRSSFLNWQQRIQSCLNALGVSLRALFGSG